MRQMIIFFISSVERINRLLLNLQLVTTYFIAVSSSGIHADFRVQFLPETLNYEESFVAKNNKYAISHF